MKHFFRKKAIQLLVPYASFTLIVSLLKLAHFAHHGLPSTVTVEHGVFIVLWGGEAMKGIYGVLWFLTCLFLTRQLANVLLVRCRPRVLGAAAFLSLLLSYGDSLLLPHVSPPSDANVVLAALPFFIAGYFCRATLLDGWPLATASAVGIAVLFLLIIHGGVRIAYNMRSAVYGVPILTPVLAFCCIFACIFACKLLAQSPAQSF